MEKVPHNKIEGPLASPPEGLWIAITVPLRMERKSPPRCVTDGTPYHAASGLFQLVRCRVFIIVIIIFVSIIIINNIGIVVFLNIIPTTSTFIIVIINAIIFVSLIIINIVIVVFLTIIPTTFTIINPITTIITPITSNLFSLRYEHQPLPSS
ncbi:unnamed protein product [Gadus morhua 'NCC']